MRQERRGEETASYVIVWQVGIEYGGREHPFPHFRITAHTISFKLPTKADPAICKNGRRKNAAHVAWIDVDEKAEPRGKDA